MDYRLIADAVEHYRARGYVYVQEAPWYVDPPAYEATRPPGASDIRIGLPAGPIGNLVASGEQSFIQMMVDGQPLKRALCVTPCFRWEQRLDEFRRIYFMKVELINAHDVDEGHLMHMVHDACSFFERSLPDIRVVRTEQGYDIVEKDTRVELGSYGIRDVVVAGHRLRWVYGTGCAEPRLSTVLQRRWART